MATSDRLSPHIEERIEALSRRTGQSKADLLSHILESGLDDVEDYYEAIETLERIRSGQETVYTEAEVMARLGLDN